jgi:hypothetical protein
VYLEIHSIIRGTRQFVDDISARYFHGFHPHLPIISRTRFYDNLIALGAAPAADFSILLLTTCLITYAPALGYRSERVADPSAEQRFLYLTARSLFTQVQVSSSPSVPLIQAGLLLAVYEYMHGRPDDAFVTIAVSTRMAYAARIHGLERQQAHLTHNSGHIGENHFVLQAEEAANTWWGIVIYERYVFPYAWKILNTKKTKVLLVTEYFLAKLQFLINRYLLFSLVEIPGCQLNQKSWTSLTSQIRILYPTSLCPVWRRLRLEDLVGQPKQIVY